MQNLTSYPDQIAISDALLINEGWVRGTNEDQVLFVVQVKGRSCGYVTVAEQPDTLWIRELYLDGRTWRGSPKGGAFPVLHRGLGKLILTYFDTVAHGRGRRLGIFTTRSLGLLKACDHLFGDRCSYHVTDGEPPRTLFRQRRLHWLADIEQFSASVPGLPILVFEKGDQGFHDGRNPETPYFLRLDESRMMRVEDGKTGQSYGLEDGLLVSIGPCVDILIDRRR